MVWVTAMEAILGEEASLCSEGFGFVKQLGFKPGAKDGGDRG